MSHPEEGLVLKARVAAPGATCDYDVPSFVSPNLQGPLVSAWQLGETHLGPGENISETVNGRIILLT